jgi:hypothetical protein
MIDRSCSLTFEEEVNTEATSGSKTTATTGRPICAANRFGFARE